uniref:GCR071 n=1 Tax=Schmidtea mediterranea TaxID=79327 RepID=A0A193KUP4_SCHMD|nr:GCR071 [Schmidtea mediterranea]
MVNCSNCGLGKNSTNSPFPPAVSWTLGFLSAVVSVSTIMGNLLVIVSFFFERALRTSTNYFIASLAVTDLLIGVFSMNFYTVYLLLSYWPLGELFCDLWLSLDYTACLTSQYTVFFITVDRFCSVKIPAKYRNWRTESKVRLMVAITWIVPFAVFFTTIMGWPYFNNQGRIREPDQCYAEFAKEPIFNTILTIAYFWITLMVMVILYAGIYKVALNLQAKSDHKKKRISELIPSSSKRMTETSESGIRTSNASQSLSNSIKQSSYHLGVIQMLDNTSSIWVRRKIENDFTHNKVSSQNSPKQTNNEILYKNNANKRSSSLIAPIKFVAQYFYKKSDKSTKRRERTVSRARKALRTITFILGAFVLSWTPFHIIVLIKGFCDSTKDKHTCVNSHLYNLTYWLCYLNSPINPFCYALANVQFKRTFLRILKFDFRRS